MKADAKLSYAVLPRPDEAPFSRDLAILFQVGAGCDLPIPAIHDVPGEGFKVKISDGLWNFSRMDSRYDNEGRSRR